VWLDEEGCDVRRMKYHGKMKNEYKIVVGNVNEGDYFEDLGIYGRIILKWVLQKFDVKACSGFTSLMAHYSI
jgi:hypothetical protein